MPFLKKIEALITFRSPYGVKNAVILDVLKNPFMKNKESQLVAQNKGTKEIYFHTRKPLQKNVAVGYKTKSDLTIIQSSLHIWI